MRQKQTMTFFVIAILTIFMFILVTSLSLYSSFAKKREAQRELKQAAKLEEFNQVIGQADQIKYAPDGKHIYALRRRNSDIGVNKSVLYQITSDPNDSMKISENVDNIVPSPSGKYLLIDNGTISNHGFSTITIFNCSSHSKICTLRQQYPFSPYGWKGKSSSIWYSGIDDIIYLYDLDSKKKTRVAIGAGLNCSENGSYFAYRQDQSNNDSSELLVRNFQSKSVRHVIKEEHGQIDYAIFSHNSRTIYYVLIVKHVDTLGNGFNESQLKSVDLDGANSELLWSSLSDANLPTTTSTIGITGLTLTANGSELLFMARDWVGITSLDVRLNISTKKNDRIMTDMSNIWDYNANNNSIAWLDTSKHGIFEEKLD